MPFGKGGDTLAADFSLADFGALEKHLPRFLRKEFSPLIRQMKEIAAYEKNLPEIEAAQDQLETYREEYEQLIQDPVAFFKRSDTLFSETPFESMRFGVEELERAFETVGHPPACGDEKFVAFAGRVVDCLLDDQQRTALATRLICMVPALVAQERYLDAWVLQHSSILVCDPPENGCGPFLLCMFMHGIRQWGASRELERHELFDSLGIDQEEMLRHGYKELDALLPDAAGRRDKLSKIERFLAEHPQLEAQMQAQCRDAEEAALELLGREEGQSLLLDEAEVQPWLPILSERIAANPKLVEEAQKNTEHTKKIREDFMEIMYTISTEMTVEIFTVSRIRRLRNEIDACRKRFEGMKKDESLALSGAFMAVGETTQPEGNHFLTMLCLHSVVRVMQNLGGVPGTSPST